MILDALATLVTEAELGVPGETLFTMSLPADLPHGIALKTPLAGIAFDIELPGFYQTRLQAIVRDGDYERGAELAEKLFEVFKLGVARKFEIRGKTLELMVLHPVSLPIEYPRQESNQYEWSLNLRSVYRMLSGED